MPEKFTGSLWALTMGHVNVGVGASFKVETVRLFGDNALH